MYGYKSPDENLFSYMLSVHIMQVVSHPHTSLMPCDPDLDGCHSRVPVLSTWRANWDLWLENTMDPSHVNWLHDGAAGKWEDAHPMHMRLLNNHIDAHQVPQPPHRLA